MEDTESIYVADAASTGLSLSTTQGPRSAEIIDVEYATRTWSCQRSSSVLLAGSLSPSLIKHQIATGRFTVVGPASVNGHQAVELTWTSSLGRLTVTTTLWVDARTYQPLRSVSTTRTRSGTRRSKRTPRSIRSCRPPRPTWPSSLRRSRPASPAPLRPPTSEHRRLGSG